MDPWLNYFSLSLSLSLNYSTYFSSKQAYKYKFVQLNTISIDIKNLKKKIASYDYTGKHPLFARFCQHFQRLSLLKNITVFLTDGEGHLIATMMSQSCFINFIAAP